VNFEEKYLTKAQLQKFEKWADLTINKCERMRSNTRPEVKQETATEIER